MRVIAGRLGGRRLKSAPGRAVRPTSDRVREALFSILGGDVVGARVLDLYAGTGAMAIEAISRGAERALCVERAGAALRTIGENLRTLGIEDVIDVDRGDALLYARRWTGEEEVFDVVFCDPPYADPLEPIVTELVAGGGWTRAFALEHAADAALPPTPAGLSADTRTWGDTSVTLYRRSAP